MKTEFGHLTISFIFWPVGSSWAVILVDHKCSWSVVIVEAPFRDVQLTSL